MDTLWEVTETTLTVVFLLLVVVAAIPIFSNAFQLLMVPFHAWRNHYREAAPYTPRVAVIVPAWNEGNVIAASIERLMTLDYPPESLRVYVVDDASTDDTPDVVRAKQDLYPGRVVHLRREVGGEGKAHTLNHGIRTILGDSWMQATLIMDADVIYARDSLRKMTRHLADPHVGSVTAYIREGSADKTYLTRFIGIEYVLAQLAARRAQNVLGAMACLAGGAQLHSRENLEDLGSIDTATLAEDTVTTIETQLRGRRAVFEPHAVVLAEEPQAIAALWKQRAPLGAWQLPGDLALPQCLVPPAPPPAARQLLLRHPVVQRAAAPPGDDPRPDRFHRAVLPPGTTGEHGVPQHVDRRGVPLRLHPRARPPARPQHQSHQLA